jgi:hypothetical protein
VVKLLLTGLVLAAADQLNAISTALFAPFAEYPEAELTFVMIM